MAPPEMTNVPSEYHDFADVFSDSLSEKLPEHRLYNLKINIEKGTFPLFGPIYSLSESKLKALCEFIDNKFEIRASFCMILRGKCAHEVFKRASSDA